jgi:hypothetical protein
MARRLPDSSRQERRRNDAPVRLIPFAVPRTYSTLEVHRNVHIAAVSFSRRSASGPTGSFHVPAAAGGTGRDRCGIRLRSPSVG